LARRAIAAGAEVAIDSDGHRAEMLDRQMQLGILTARVAGSSRGTWSTRDPRRCSCSHRPQTRRTLIARPVLGGAPMLPALSVDSRLRALSRHAAPSFDFGTQAICRRLVGSPLITPRAATRCISRLETSSWHITGVEPARALNLASAVEAAIACALLVLVGAELTGSSSPAPREPCCLPRRTRFGARRSSPRCTRFTCLFVALTTLLLLRWAARPTLGRLALFFAVYALGLRQSSLDDSAAPAVQRVSVDGGPGGWRSMLEPRVIVLALACACAGALQYAATIHTLWLHAAAAREHRRRPATLLVRRHENRTGAERWSWALPRVMLGDQPPRCTWSICGSNFGSLDPHRGRGLRTTASQIGPRTVLMLLLYAVNLVFAYSYNVGDAHVFYLPSHSSSRCWR